MWRTPSGRSFGAEQPGEWKSSQTLHPLEGPETPARLHTDAKVAISVSAKTGAAELTVASRGSSYEEVKETYWFWIQALGFVFLLVLLVGGYYGYGMYTTWASTQAKEAWLRDFYSANAPEKLSDPQHVRNTIAKHKDKMFLLWRQLQKTYNVKWVAPDEL